MGCLERRAGTKAYWSSDHALSLLFWGASLSTHICIYIYAFTYMYVYIYIYMYIHVYVHMY